MTNLDKIAELLEEASLGRRGESIFIYRMPAEAIGFLLREGHSGDLIDHELPGYRKGDFMLTYRSNDAKAGQAQMKSAMSVLTFQDVEYDEIMYYYCRPEREPMVYPLSLGNMVEQMVMFNVRYILL